MDMEQLELLAEDPNASFLGDLTPDQIDRLHTYIERTDDFADIMEAVYAEAQGFLNTAESIKIANMNIAEDVDYILYGSKH